MIKSSECKLLWWWDAGPSKVVNRKEMHLDESNVYWTVHHCNSWRMKDQLDVTCYFIPLLMCSTCFGHQYIHHQELATVLMNYHIGRLALSSLCVGDLVRLVLSGALFAGWSTTQHTTNWEQDDRCVNSTTQSQAPDDGYIDVRNMLST